MHPSTADICAPSSSLLPTSNVLHVLCDGTAAADQQRLLVHMLERGVYGNFVLSAMQQLHDIGAVKHHLSCAKELWMQTDAITLKAPERCCMGLNCGHSKYSMSCSC